MDLRFQYESSLNDSNISPSRSCATQLHEANLGSLSGSAWDFHRRAFSAVEYDHHDCSSPDVNRELIVPSSSRNPDTGLLCSSNPHPYPFSVRQHVQLSNSSPSPLLNPLINNGFPSATSPLINHGLLNPSPSPLQTFFVSEPISQHGPPQHPNTPSSPTKLQYLSHQLPDIFGNLDSQSPLDFAHIRSDYLTMISTKNSDTDSARKTEGRRSLAPDSSSLSPVTPFLDNDVAFHAVADMLEGSPDYKMKNDFSEYLTSPLDDSPWEDDMLTTPSFGSAGDMGVDILTSPALLDSNDAYTDMPLFSDSHPFDLTFEKLNKQPSDETFIKNSPSQDCLPLPPSPPLDSHPSSAFAAPPRSTSKAKSINARKTKSHRKITPTGTRKNVTPESLIPVEAPIQCRKYVTSSATSRKELPAVFARKRRHSVAFSVEEEEDQLAGDISTIPPTPSEMNAIEAKRLQNTLAARRSRKRKLEYQRELESSMESLRSEKEAWKARAIAFERLLTDHGIRIPLGLEDSHCRN